MADVEITLGFTTAQAQALAPMFESEARGMARHPWVRRVLAARGIESVDELTPRQQAKLVLKCWTKAKQQQHKRREAEISYGETAAQVVEDEFPIEVD